MHEVRWCFHATATVHDYELTRDALLRLVGGRVLEDTIDPNPRVSRRVGITWVGDHAIALGQPIAGNTPSAAFLSRHGPGFTSVAVQVANLEATAAHLARLDVRFTWADPRFGFSHPADTAGVLVEWFEGPVPVDPRAGGEILAPSASLLDVTRVAFVGAVVDDPRRAAERLASVLATDVTFVASAGDRSAGDVTMPGAGVSLGDMTLALYPRPEPADAFARWGMALAVPRVHAVAVLVADLEAARAALEREGIPAARDAGRHLVLAPHVAGGVCLVVTDELLPNDPRAATSAHEGR